MDARKELAESLFGVIAGDAPFLLLLADREPDSVFKSSGSLFDRGMVRIFSGAVTATTPLRSREEEGGPKKKWLGRGEGGLAVAGFVLFVLGLAWIGKVYPPPPPRPSDLEGRTETNGGVVEGQGEALVEAASNREMETNPSGATQEGDATIDTKAEDPEREIVEDRPSIGVPSSDETVAGESDAKDEVAPATTAPVEELPSEPGLAVPETETPLDVDEPPPIPDSDGAPATAEESLLSPDLSELTETVVQEETSVMSPPNGERPQTPLSKREISRGKRHKSSPVRKNRKQVRISLLPPAPSTEVPPTNSPPEFQQTPEHLSEGLSPESCRGVPERPIQNPD
ncbi:MAG: hypothetical protein IK066_07945 [Kiritimatiellae bacterium]|nr:hypothetical protein [Kiritimatiellia bacterium]